MLTRRQFVKAAVLAGAAAAVPPGLEAFLQSARAASGTDATRYFLTRDDRWNTCAALCARIVPTGANPMTDPGAAEAAAVVFIDRFLAAFDLPSSVADHPPIWVTGPWSGRNRNFDEATGQIEDSFPADDFLTAGPDPGTGTGHFLGLTPAQALSWQVQLKGVAVLKQAPAWAGKWADQVGSLIPLPAPAIGLQKAYEEGLDAFNSWSKSVFGAPYYRAGTEQQDLMLSLAGNVVLGAVTGNVPLPSPPAPPAAATALFPIIALHTFQATYGIPEYSWRNQDNDGSVERPGGTAQWRAIAYDGDTQPLGNSLYDPNMTFPRGQDPNEGFGLEGQAPKGGYREYRPVSTLDPNHGTVLTAADVAALKAALAGEKEAAK